MYNEIVHRAISADKDDALAAFCHLIDSCQMNAEIAEYIRENAALSVISNRAAKFNRYPTRNIEKMIYGTVFLLVMLGMFTLGRHVYREVMSKKTVHQSIERPS